MSGSAISVRCLASTRVSKCDVQEKGQNEEVHGNVDSAESDGVKDERTRSVASVRGQRVMAA